jgi:hypothetical protein
MNILRLLTLAALGYLLAGCSPHPGAGNWQSTAEQSPDFTTGFVRLEVGFEGRTDIFEEVAANQQGAATSTAATRRCFWRGKDAQTIMLTCVQAANTDIEESYQLHIGPDNQVAELLQGEKVVGRFMRETRPDIEHSYKEILQPR